MRAIGAYLLIWLLLLSVRPARDLLAAQFRRLPSALRRSFWLGALGGMGLVVVNGGLFLWSRAVSFTPSYEVATAAILAAVAFAAVVATTEEMLLRGLLLTRFREIWTPAAAVLATSFLFAVMHVGRSDFSLGGTAQYFVDGLLLAWMTLVTGDVWMAAGFHFAKNLGVYMLFGGSRHLVAPLLTEPAPAPLLDVLSYAAIVPLLWLALRRGRWQA